MSKQEYIPNKIIDVLYFIRTNSIQIPKKCNAPLVLYPFSKLLAYN